MSGEQSFEDASPTAEATKARLTVKFNDLASQIAKLTTEISDLAAHLALLTARERELPTRADGKFKPRQERLADARRRNRCRRGKFQAAYARHVATEKRDALAAEAAGLARALVGLGFGAEELRIPRWEGEL